MHTLWNEILLLLLLLLLLVLLLLVVLPLLLLQLLLLLPLLLLLLVTINFSFVISLGWLYQYTLFLSRAKTGMQSLDYPVPIFAPAHHQTQYEELPQRGWILSCVF